jgi:hypothetical protein
VRLFPQCLCGLFIKHIAAEAFWPQSALVDTRLNFFGGIAWKIRIVDF